MIAELRRGAVANLPVASSVAAYGSVLGVLAVRQQISWQALLAMNLSVFAGSAQFVMVEMWLPPLPVLLVLIGFIGLMGIDGVNSYSHFFPNAPHLYEPRNWMRLRAICSSCETRRASA